VDHRHANDVAAGFCGDALEVVSTGFITDPDDDAVVAAMVLDTTGRPDVADLARVHASEGIGDVRCGVGVLDIGPPDTWLVRLEVAVDHPVRCRFHAVVDWLGHRSWLAAVADGASVAVGAGTGAEYWLRLNVDPDMMRPVLELLERRTA
jgi:hypothetical protein